jgi:prolyl oligopeptidase
MGFASFMAGERNFTVLFTPTERAFLQGAFTEGDVVALSVLDDVRSRVILARPQGAQWQIEKLEGFAEQAVVDVGGFDQDFSDSVVPPEEAGQFTLYVNNAVTPLTVSLVRFGEKPEPLKSAPARFDAGGLSVTQHHATADDGTRIPYFQVGPADLKLDGNNATLLTGYGGFQISLQPNYAGINGKLWLERGGVYVMANLRGGGEFGPAWHEAGRRAGKKIAQDDMAAVARDLIARGVTRTARLACQGGSNGGLLTGNMYARYPELFGAVISQVPLLDMWRYTKLSAGQSWIAEYGDPDKPEDWAFLRLISAYQLVQAGRKYPPILLTTSARDDRVHPGHARKMAEKLRALGLPVYFHEPPEGGHAGAADNANLAYNEALSYAFLRHTIAPEMG